jgi:phage tail sheath protein FI
MDIEGRDQLNNVVTSSITQRFSVTNTANAFRSRNLDSSFAAAYFPDLVMIDPDGAEQQVPASVGVLGAFSKNDSLAHPWFAPAGFARGSMNSVIDTAVKLNRDNMDSLYDVDINPITSFPQSSDVVVFGQKTLQAADSALDRVNVRRLLIDVRRKVKTVANSILFEPNRESTLARFSAAVDPILATIQAQQGVDRFKVVIDTSTTTQIDVENNTVRGKIFLQPTRSVEFISLDFVVTNAGADI